jgi:translation initiation factor 1
MPHFIHHIPLKVFFVPLLHILYKKIMKYNDWKDRLNIVYSTNPNYQYETDDAEEAETLPKEKQALRISLDKRNRGGKKVTLITGFIGKNEDLETLGKWLKVKCGVGGSAKDGEIIIQGDFRDKIYEILQKDGYQKARII